MSLLSQSTQEYPWSGFNTKHTTIADLQGEIKEQIRLITKTQTLVLEDEAWTLVTRYDEPQPGHTTAELRYFGILEPFYSYTRPDNDTIQTYKDIRAELARTIALLNHLETNFKETLETKESKQAKETTPIPLISINT